MIRELRELATVAQTLTTVWRQTPGSLKENQETLEVREHSARTITALSIAAVNGLAQTEAYMRALFDTLDKPAKEAAAGVAARLRRQAILLDPGHTITMLHTEGALRARYGAVVMHVGQLDHLATLMAMPHIRIGILPYAIQAPIVYASRLCLYTDQADGSPDEVEVESHAGEVLSTDPHTVTRYRRRLERAEGAALWDDQARDFLERVRAEQVG